MPVPARPGMSSIIAKAVSVKLCLGQVPYIISMESLSYNIRMLLG